MLTEWIEPIYTPVIAGVLILAYYIVPYLLDPYSYRRRFSGPWLAQFTNWWLSQAVKTGHHSEIIYEIHKKYGMFVRVGPNHISIAHPDAHEAVYGHGVGLLKSDFYQTFVNGKPNAFSTQDRAEHTRMRKRTANLFSLQNILEFEPRVHKYVRQLCAQWDMRCNAALKDISGSNWIANGGRAVLDCCPQFAYLAYDIIGDLALGGPFGMVEAQEDAARPVGPLGSAQSKGIPIISIQANSGMSAAAVGVYPAWVRPFLLRLPWNLAGLINQIKLFGLATAIMDAKLRRFSEEQEKKDGVDLFDKLLEVRNEDGSPLTRQELAAEAIVFLVAGSDTTSNSLGALCYYMATHPHAQRQLQAELDTHVPLEPAAEDDEYNDSSLPQANVVANFEQVKGLPYLNACIKEAMRLHTTVSGTGMQRVVPPGKTFTFAGETFKEGSIVSVPSFTTNRAGIWGSDATEFRPERWLEDSSGKLGKYHIPFSLGPRACLGRNLANMELLVIVATIFRRYDVEIAGANTKLHIHEGFIREAAHCDVAIKRREVL